MKEAVVDITDSCLDAETLAAWVDGGSDRPELERAQTHVADCARCQAIVGTLARIDGGARCRRFERASATWLAWLVPLTAAAAAVADLGGHSRKPARHARVHVQSPPATSSRHTTVPQETGRRSCRSLAVKPQLVRRSDASTAPVPTGRRAWAKLAKQLRRTAPQPSAVDCRRSRRRLAPAAAADAAGLRPRRSLPYGRGAWMRRHPAVLGVGSIEPVARHAQIVSPDPNVRWRSAGQWRGALHERRRSVGKHAHRRAARSSGAGCRAFAHVGVLVGGACWSGAAFHRRAHLASRAVPGEHESVGDPRQGCRVASRSRPPTAESSAPPTPAPPGFPGRCKVSERLRSKGQEPVSPWRRDCA